MNKSSAQDQTPGGFEGGAGGSKGNPTPTAKHPAQLFEELSSAVRKWKRTEIARYMKHGSPNPASSITAFSPLTTVPYLLDVHGLSLSEAYLLAQRNLEACS
jgi:hypothetical protein